MDNARDFFPEGVTDDDLGASSGASHAVREIIPDHYLNQAIGACCSDNGRLVLSRAVRDLIAHYAPTDRPWMNEIPRERRRQFLNELASTTGRALPPDEPIRAEPTLPRDEPIWAKPTLAGQDAKLIINGYEPIAVSGKAAVAKGWNTRPSTIEAVAAQSAGVIMDIIDRERVGHSAPSPASSTAARDVKRGPSQAGISGALLEAALGYGEGGIPVFPCNPDNKKPLTEHGFKDATTDPEKIRSWWREHPQAMIGVPTGPASGIFVID